MIVKTCARLLVALSLFAGPAFAATYNVSTPAALADLVAKPRQAGDVIQLAPGVYGGIGFQNVKIPAPGVVFASADPAHPATVAGVELAQSDGFTFRDLELTVYARTSKVFSAVDGERVHVIGGHLHDPSGARRSGLLFRNMRDVSLRNAELDNLSGAVGLLDVAGAVVTGNSFHDMFGDGVDGVHATQVTISDNRFTDFYPSAGDHPDAIQFWTLNTTASSTDIAIERNVITRGRGGITQGIFLGNEIDMPYQRVRIAGNMLVGTMYNGIACGVCETLTLANNTVQPWSDMPSGIVVERSKDVTSTGNRAGSFQKIGASVNLVESANTILAAVAVGDVSMAPTLPVGPPVVQLPPVAPPAPVVPVIDTKDAVINALTAAGLAELGVVRAERDAARAALAQAVELAIGGGRLTSMAKAKPVFAAIAALKVFP